jgi:hypothetical protein
MCKNATIAFCDDICPGRELCRHRGFDDVVDYLYEIGFDKLLDEMEQHGHNPKRYTQGN